MLVGPHVSCERKHDCKRPGISRGWSDNYDSGLDCQWIDITDIVPGTYRLRVEVNVNRSLMELTTENNTVEVVIDIPALDINNHNRTVYTTLPM